MSNQFSIPAMIITGENALDDASAHVSGLGAKALIVSDRTMYGLGHVGMLVRILESRGIACSVYDSVNSEPTDTMIYAGAKLYLTDGCDFLVALGGGSPIDAMKAIALIAARGGEISDYMGKVVDGVLPPMAAIPTTAGTGSEVTQFTIITDTARNVKMLLKGPAFLPRLAIVDPRFTVSAPQNVTASTGIDALTHAIECYTSRRAQPLSDIFAVSAVRRIFANLKTACDHPGDVRARTEMSLAALEAGIALNNSSVTIVHGMSRPIGALFHIPHGLSNAMLLETCLSFAIDGAPGRFADLGRAISAARDGDSNIDAAGMFMAEVRDLLNGLGIPRLKEYGIDKSVFDANIAKMAKDAFESGSPSNTRKEITTADMEKIYAGLWK